MLNSNISSSSTCHGNMVNFSLLTAEICWRVWGTPVNFNGIRVLAALLHGTLEVGVSQTFAQLNRGRHLYSAGRPSRCALAHSSRLWPPYVIGQAIIFSSCRLLYFFFFSSPNLSRRRLDVYHTFTHGVALVRI